MKLKSKKPAASSSRNRPIPPSGKSAGKMSLAEIQRTIAGTLMRPLTSAELMRPDAAETANRIVKPNDRLTAFERLQIYNQQYWWRLLGSFQDDFRGLRAVLGERKFDRLAVAYLDACGSTSWNLRDLGQALEPFLGQHPELVAPHGTLALEMVRVEWARVIAFDGPEKPPLDPTKLGLAPELLRFELQPYVTLLELTYPVDKLLGRLRKSNTGIASNAVSASRRRGPVRLSASPAPRPIHIAVHRVDLAVYYKRLDAEAYRLLCALRSGATLADACGAAFADSRDLPEQAAAKIREWFATWMGFGWLVRR